VSDRSKQLAEMICPDGYPSWVYPWLAEPRKAVDLSDEKYTVKLMAWFIMRPEARDTTLPWAAGMTMGAEAAAQTIFDIIADAVLPQPATREKVE